MITLEQLTEAHRIVREGQTTEQAALMGELTQWKFLAQAPAKWPFKEGDLRCIEEKRA